MGHIDRPVTWKDVIRRASWARIGQDWRRIGGPWAEEGLGLVRLAGKREQGGTPQAERAKQRDWKPANPLFMLPDIVVTPHAVYYSEEAIRIVRDSAAREVVRVLTGQPPASPVNADQLRA
jgi:hypothetical protein